MIIFGNNTKSRGCWIEVQTSRGSISRVVGEGARLVLPNGDSWPATPGRDPYFVTGISITQKEKYNIVQCFDDRNYTYAFGHDPTASLVEVSFISFIINSDGRTVGDALRTQLTGYNTSRLSQQPRYAKLTLGRCAISGFVVGMGSNTVDAEHNIQNFTIFLLLVEAQR